MRWCAGIAQAAVSILFNVLAPPDQKSLLVHLVNYTRFLRKLLRCTGWKVEAIPIDRPKGRAGPACSPSQRSCHIAAGRQNLIAWRVLETVGMLPSRDVDGHAARQTGKLAGAGVWDHRDTLRWGATR